MVGGHHRLNGHGFGWTPGVGVGQGDLACCSSWGHKESDWVTELNWFFFRSSPISLNDSINHPVFKWKIKSSYSTLMAQRVKNLPSVQETWVLSLCWEDPMEKGLATYSCILAWRIPWTEEPGGLQSWGCKESDTTERLTLSLPSTLSSALTPHL